jgi:hypothetical protein
MAGRTLGSSKEITIACDSDIVVSAGFVEFVAAAESVK